METELCAFSLAACRAAARAGCTRVELCASPLEGGTTPSAATIRMARAVAGIRLSVMIRPRGGDFFYSAEEFRQMELDIASARALGADGVVFGLLRPDGQVDAERTAALVAAAAPLEVTFHRAVDLTPDPVAAVEPIREAGCRRILTSGGSPTAEQGIETIRRMVERAAGRIAIMAGSGVYARNARLFVEAGVDALHFSARIRRPSGMTYRRPGMTLDGTPAAEAYGAVDADPEAIRALLSTLHHSL